MKEEDFSVSKSIQKKKNWRYYRTIELERWRK